MTRSILALLGLRPSDVPDDAREKVDRFSRTTVAASIVDQLNREDEAKRRELVRQLEALPAQHGPRINAAVARSSAALADCDEAQEAFTAKRAAYLAAEVERVAADAGFREAHARLVAELRRASHPLLRDLVVECTRVTDCVRASSRLETTTTRKPDGRIAPTLRSNQPELLAACEAIAAIRAEAEDRMLKAEPVDDIVAFVTRALAQLRRLAAPFQIATRGIDAEGNLEQTPTLARQGVALHSREFNAADARALDLLLHHEAGHAVVAEKLTGVRATITYKMSRQPDLTLRGECHNAPVSSERDQALIASAGPAAEALFDDPYLPEPSLLRSIGRRLSGNDRTLAGAFLHDPGVIREAIRLVRAHWPAIEARVAIERPRFTAQTASRQPEATTPAPRPLVRTVPTAATAEAVLDLQARAAAAATQLRTLQAVGARRPLSESEGSMAWLAAYRVRAIPGLIAQEQRLAALEAADLV